MIKITCPDCEGQQNARESSIGSLVRCKRCGTMIDVVQPLKAETNPLIGCLGIVIAVIVGIVVVDKIQNIRLPVPNRQVIAEVPIPVSDPKQEPDPVKPDVAIPHEEAPPVEEAPPIPEEFKHPLLEEKEKPSISDEKKAKTLLRMAQELEKLDKIPAAIQSYKKLINLYPDTQHAKTAQEKLKSLTIK